MSSVTHELRTPLTSIRALAELMLDNPAMDAEQRQHFLGLVVAETERLTGWSTRCSTWRRSNRAVPNGAASRSTCARWCSRPCRPPRSCSASVARSWHCNSPDAVPPLQADPDRLTQVLIDLLSNAAKFVPPGRGRVELSLRAAADRVTITVQDNGPGVPPEQQALVFESSARAAMLRIVRRVPAWGCPSPPASSSISAAGCGSSQDRGKAHASVSNCPCGARRLELEARP